MIESFVHLVDSLFGTTLIMGLILMSTDFWRRKQRSQRQKAVVIILALLTSIALVVPTAWSEVRMAILAGLLALMVIVRHLSGRNPLGFLLGMAAMGGITGLEIIMGVGKSWVPFSPQAHLVFQGVGISLFVIGVSVAMWG